jgi:hypothetical protein
MRFYKYIIYKLYHSALKKKSNTPATNVILMLSFVHYIQLLCIYSILLKIFPQIPLISITNETNKIYLGLGLIIFAVLHHFIFYNKKRWDVYIEEFKDENPLERRKGTILVYSYLIGSVLIFFLLMPLLFGF